MRPTNPCARCVRDSAPGCEHLAKMYDRALLKGQSEQDLIEYALNRMWALERDNGNKAEGKKARHTYHSRNVASVDALARKCQSMQGVLRCMRNANHEGNCKF